MNIKQKKIQIEPKVKLNYNIYLIVFGDITWKLSKFM